MRIGVIGTGNMGSILVEAMMDAHAISPSCLSIHNRTRAKAEQLRQEYPELQIFDDVEKLVQTSDCLFICVKPHDIFPLLQQIKPHLQREHCLVSITSPVAVEQLELHVDCSTARIIPSITNRALTGVSLFTFGKKCTDRWKTQLLQLFKGFSKPHEISQNITRVTSDIVSCGPAFYSYITRRFIDGAVRETEIDTETATVLVSEMLIGLGELLRQGHYTLPTLEEKVTVKGGITGEGIKVLEKELNGVFEKLFQATHAKFREDLEKVKEQFNV
ncbi:competence protein ComER [Bacillus oleivorans]|uniref:Competence protein ComER n=1 Tax=Bacillus oleivorans TaxID=1448271 RepID=A0A285CKF7_9BACI|nr:late competence protein ComER [Bacillus oleivorans]SNX67845.1 competence protein ComER [Bacillus oleivorans]